MFIKELDRTCVLLVVSAVIVIINSAGLAGGAPDTEDITGVVWKWHQTRYNNDQQSVPDDPTRYTIAFNLDGTLNIRADCNRGGGTYTTEGKSITIEVTHTTRAMCPPESLDQNFIKDLNAVKIYFFSEEYLYLDLQYDSGTMKFDR